MKVLKWLAIGCGGMILLLLLLGLIMWLGVRSWIHHELPLSDPRVLAGQDTRAIVTFELSPEDSEAKALVRHLITSADKGKNLDSLAWWLNYGSVEALGEGLLPLRMGALEDENGDVMHFVSFSRHAQPLIRVIEGELQGRGSVVARVGERRIFQIDGRFAAVADGSAIWSDSQERLQAVLERWGQQPVSTPLLSLYAARGGALRLALVDGGQYLARKMDTIHKEGEPSLTEIGRQLGFAASDVKALELTGTVGPDKALGRWQVQLEPGVDRERFAGGIARFADAVVAELAGDGVECESEVAEKGQDGVEVRFTLSKLKESFWARFGK